MANEAPNVSCSDSSYKRAASEKLVSWKKMAVLAILVLFVLSVALVFFTLYPNVPKKSFLLNSDGSVIQEFENVQTAVFLEYNSNQPEEGDVAFYYTKRFVPEDEQSLILCDKMGTVINDSGIDSLGEVCSSGLIAAYVDGRGGYLDSKGNWVIEPQYVTVKDFFLNGVAEVMTSQGQTYYIDRNNNQVTPEYLQMETPKESGIALAKDVNTGRYGYINAQGSWVVTPQFVWAEAFGEGSYAFVVPDSGVNNSGIIDSSGTMVVDPILKLEKTSSFTSEDVAFVRGYNGNLGCIDSSGNWLFESQGIVSKLISHGGYGAFFHKSLNRWVVINNSGEQVYVAPAEFYPMPLTYDRWFMEDTEAKLYGVIDAQGNWIVEPCYDEVTFSTFGLAFALGKKELSG